MKKIIKITESDLHNIIKESVSKILTESQESKSQSEAIKLVMDKLGYDYEQANNFIRKDLRNEITSLRNKNIAKFTLGVARMYCDRQITDANTISGLNATLKLLSAHINEYDRNLNGISAQELINKFAQTRRDNIDAEKNEIESLDFSQGSRYKIVPINSFEEAQKYYKYTNPDSPWCLTHMEGMFDSYTNNGMNQIYFCLREGFENEPYEISDNAPLDNYGLSMLSIIVNENGELAYCTTRWNHDNGGTDSAMSAKEVSQVVGVNFYEVFKPNNKWNDLLSNVIDMMSRGVPYENIFDDVDNFHNGFAKVELNDKYNFINTNGEFISNQWFDDVDNFRNGFAKVELNSKYNYINTNGELVSNQWFDWTYDFHNGFSRVRLNGKYNFVNTNRELISNQWFDEADNFLNGFSRVELNDKYNYINTNGELISNQWFDMTYDFFNGFAFVELNDKYNYINTNGELISNQWFDDIDSFEDGFAKVELNGEFNYINTKGELISNQWFDEVYSFENGFATIKLNGKWNFINTNGELISNQWFDWIEDDFWNGFAIVILNGKDYKIDTNGELYNLNENKTYKMKKTIRFTESDLHKIIKESVKKIFEYNYKNHDKKIKVAQYLNGKNRDEMRDEWKDLIAKRTAIADINRERDILSLDSHEKEFNKQISSKTFDINFDDLYDNIYDDVL